METKAHELNGATLKSQKYQLRKSLQDSLFLLPVDVKQAESTAVVSRIAAMIAHGQYQRVALFAALENEVNLVPLLKLLPDCDFYFPRCSTNRQLTFHLVKNDDEFELSRWGIREPKENAQKLSIQQIPLVIVPACAYTLQGDRLGYGGGYYDTLMELFPNQRYVGVCFKEQIVSELPTEDHDLRVSEVITP